MKASEALHVRLALLKSGKKVHFTHKLSVRSPHGYCWACGTVQEWNKVRVIDDKLAEQWKLSTASRDAFDARESMYCNNCGCSFRLRELARVIVYYYGGTALNDLVEQPEFCRLKIAEINSCGNLHQFLEQIPSLAYSEYGSKNPKIPSEDLQNLSYKDASFDLILTSDTLEHVPDFKLALEEINRVLKPGGRHIFTIPVVWDRRTLSRAKLGPKGDIKNLQRASYHGAGQPDYLVFTEFGYDILEVLKKRNYSVNLIGVNPINLNDASGVFVVSKMT